MVTCTLIAWCSTTTLMILSASIDNNNYAKRNSITKLIIVPDNILLPPIIHLPGLRYLQTRLSPEPKPGGLRQTTCSGAADPHLY
ncbi:hypothetical protein V1509DRAFT_622608 [Lipomyces kononenkoae]